MPKVSRWITAAAVASAAMLAGAVRSQAAGPTISHEPVAVAARGQAISILARIRAGDAPLKTVTLYYTPSRDASPIAQPMTPTGGDVYVGTIPATHLTTAPSVQYYLEAVDLNDEWAETTWYQVQIRDAVPAGNPAVTRPAPATTPAPAAATPAVAGSQGGGDRGGMSTGALIGGGALAAGAAVAIVAAAGSGGGGGGSSDNADANNTGGGGGGDTNTVVCTADDAIGTWTGTTSAPGFILGANGAAQFFATVNGVPDEGSYGLVDCTLRLMPSSPTNVIYRGSGELSEDKTSVTINGITFTRL